jgi:2-(1,2-epoxy-1,2-dihydrophenyl)acetyl-CoA isomerase
VDYEQILFERSDGVAWLRLNRPDKLNAMTSRLSEECLDAVESVKGDGSVRCLVLTGEGRGFSAGQDLTEFEERGFEELDIAEHLRSGYNRLIRALVALPKPVVAGVNGVAAGAGLSLALACDIRFASSAAKFVQAFIRIGLVPDSGSHWLLPRVVGHAKALELSMTGEQIGAEEALRIGLVNVVVPQDEYRAELDAYARRIAELPTVAAGETKRLMSEALGLSLEETLEREAAAQADQAKGDDFREGIAAFLEKRAPRFTGS